MSDSTNKNISQNNGTSKNNEESTGQSDEYTKNDVENTEKADNKKIEEIGGPKGAEPTRYGDWEINGRCYDF